MSTPTPNYELLSAYLDDELSPEDRARVEERLATDADYAATLEAFRDQQMRLRALPKESIDVRQRVMDAVGEKSTLATAENRSGWKLNPWALASLAALILLGVFLFLPNAGQDQAVVQHDSTDTFDRVRDKASNEAVEGELLVRESQAAGLSKKTISSVQQERAAPGSAPSRLERRAAPSVESDEVFDSFDAQSDLASVDEPFPAAANEAQAAKPNDFAMNLHIRQDTMLDMEEMAGPDVAAAPVELERQSKAKAVTRSRSAPTAPTFGTPAPAPAVEGAVDQQSLRVEPAGEDGSGLAGTQLDSESVFNEMTIDDVVEGVKVSRQLKVFELIGERFVINRIWHVGPSDDKSDERLTIARFREELEKVGCDYLEEQVGSVSGGEVGREIRFSVAATPEQLVKLRKSIGGFAYLERFDRIVSSDSLDHLDQPQSSWDGSLLPRVNGLDPPGDERSYLFKVIPEKEPPAKR